ncbi:MAG: phosphatase PAP2 family protein [Pseudomonadota bacterium]|uniref:acid phosphatase n=1 Tax=Phenylobacterium sp. TaxID=1871053 RepID=UPI0025ECEADF|nr:phosphatase PAP2 family protein [Phenylobacterium sp.]MBT9473465.1 phosphatase PAP2 family protein [Phenylobacterium sp.]
MTRSFTLIAGAVFAAGLAACAATTPQQALTDKPAPLNPPPTKLTGYLAPGALDGAALLGPPPAPGSLRGQADRAHYEETRALQGTPRWSQAIADNDLWGGGALKQYSCKLGVSIDERQTPSTLRVLHRIELDVRTIGTPPKNLYNRPRPLIGDDKPVCIPREDWMKTNASYPSGHSMTGWAWALILAELAPAKADAMLSIGKSVGDSRAICGVHYISDIEAGRTLAAAMVAKLHGDPQFQRDMAKARGEMARAKAAPASCS